MEHGDRYLVGETYMHKEVYIVSNSKNFDISAVHIYITVVH